jgi:hypothetical protein
VCHPHAHLGWLLALLLVVLQRPSFCWVAAAARHLSLLLLLLLAWLLVCFGLSQLSLLLAWAWLRALQGRPWVLLLALP